MTLEEKKAALESALESYQSNVEICNEVFEEGIFHGMCKRQAAALFEAEMKAILAGEE